MPDSLSSANDREPTARPGGATAVPDDPGEAYALGYADGRRLCQTQDASDDALEPVRTRYATLANAAQLSPAEQAYLAGARDAAADNLPSPPPEHRHAA
jgi:hypothetical protein